MIEDFENIEHLSDSQGLEGRDRLTQAEVSYIEEVLPMKDDCLIATRIDELGDQFPPKAIDSNKDIAEVIQPVIEEIDPMYLEAPSDSIQVEEATDAMRDIEGLSFEEWKELSFDERVEVLQKVENSIAEIAHRPACGINIENLGEGYYGYYSKSTHEITLNSQYIASDSYADYKEALDTIVHEGRHAYQDYNLNVREVHPSEGDLSNWKSNEFEYGYQDAQTCGFAAYWLQPQETDARAFAEDVLKNYLERTKV